MPSPYTINVPASAIEGLQQKLALASFPDELDGSDWDYGVPLEEVRRLAHYWQTTFDWRKQEAELNKLPQFRTSIAADGYEHLDIHFVHQRSQNPNAIPLLFVHGCECHLPLIMAGRVVAHSSHLRAGKLRGSRQAPSPSHL